MEKARDIDEYISGFPDHIREKLEEMRAIISAAAPQAVETISYSMPAFRIHGNIVYFAGYKGHIGFYPTGSGIAAFTEEISKYNNSKGAVQFPLDKPLPVALIRKMVKFRVKEDAELAKKKKTGRR